MFANLLTYVLSITFLTHYWMSWNSWNVMPFVHVMYTDVNARATKWMGHCVAAMTGLRDLEVFTAKTIWESHRSCR